MFKSAKVGDDGRNDDENTLLEAEGLSPLSMLLMLSELEESPEAGKLLPDDDDDDDDAKWLSEETESTLLAAGVPPEVGSFPFD